MSYKRTLSKIDEMGRDFDSGVLQWKQGIEHDCKMERMLETIAECAEELVEIVPEGMDTVDVSGLDLTFMDSPLPYDKEEVRSHNEATEADTYTEPMFVENNYQEQGVPQSFVLNVDDQDLKAAVSAKAGPCFDESIFQETVQLLLDYGCNDLIQNTELLKTLSRHLELSHAAGYQITGDNLDMLIKVKHMSSSNQNKSIHWFNLNAVLHRVLGNDKSGDGPIQSITELENVDFLPSAMDNQDFLFDIIPIVARVIVDKIPTFKNFKDVVVRHIPHSYTDLMKEKSTQVLRFMDEELILFILNSGKVDLFMKILTQWSSWNLKLTCI